MTLLLALVAIAIVLTGPLAHAVGDAVGLGSQAVTIWNWAKWPVLLVVVAAHDRACSTTRPQREATRPRAGSRPAAPSRSSTWIVASALFGIYVSQFGSYNKTYGTLGGVIVFLVWLWVSNLALLFGPEFDAELERSRELAAGDATARHEINLPPREAPKPLADAV